MVVDTAAEPGKFRPKLAVAPVIDTVTERFTVPPGPLQASVKLVVVVSGPVLAVPLVARAPLQPPEAAQVVALLELQVRFETLPLTTLAGLAATFTVGGGGVTVTVTVWLAEPPAPVHVRV